jgi:hypothetical protein
MHPPAVHACYALSPPPRPKRPMGPSKPLRPHLCGVVRGSSGRWCAVGCSGGGSSRSQSSATVVVLAFAALGRALPLPPTVTLAVLLLVLVRAMRLPQPHATRYSREGPQQLGAPNPAHETHAVPCVGGSGRCCRPCTPGPYVSAPPLLQCTWNGGGGGGGGRAVPVARS